ncbi:glycosyltransferase family 9 protein [Campylobacter sp.]|uniref:glycosyltransferase family 9 protein n=1 Tax=Campylobacter sp. TaxID=205 RepID=UPI0026DAEFB1|nr:glycosyltransferase family 9 protein [Campylobacter sp.]MDO4673656.1 glycosyltransferase family 9 protein [Campylobacter sp.]
MKIFIKLPTWLGDAVMASAALRALFSHFRGAQFVLYGSFVALELFRECENVHPVFERKKGRFGHFLKLRQEWGEFDHAFFFRGALSARIQKLLLRSKRKALFDKNQNKNAHQVLKYLHFVEDALCLPPQDAELFLPIKAFGALGGEARRLLCEKFELDGGKKWLGISAGAKYGSAKCWDREHFARVALELGAEYEVLIFGVASEGEICDFIADTLAKNGVRGVNLCAKTSIKELCHLISNLSLLLANDSGNMHIASVYKIKTLALFGPTKWTQSAPWQNENAKILHLNLACMPCMKRTCPLKHHKCMRDLSPEMALEAVRDF